jgi:hypothetical protein
MKHWWIHILSEQPVHFPMMALYSACFLRYLGWWGVRIRKGGASLTKRIHLRQQIRGSRSRHIQSLVRRVCFRFTRCYQNRYIQTTCTLIISPHPADLNKFAFQFKRLRGYFCMKSSFRLIGMETYDITIAGNYCTGLKRMFMNPWKIYCNSFPSIPFMYVDCFIKLH